MSAQEILALLEKDGMAAGLSLFPGPQDAALIVPPDRLTAVCQHLRDANHLSFEQCVLVTGTHMLERTDKKTKEVIQAPGFEVMIHLRSLRHHRLLALKVKLPEMDPEVDSVSQIWQSANWHERETYDMLGIQFRGHPDLRRILLPEGWVGHPLRKDYVFPREFQGISLEVDDPWPAP